PFNVPLSAGVVAWLYNPSAANTSISRLIPGTVSGSLYQFETARTPNGPYTLIVDANGYRSSSQSVTVTGTPTLIDVNLQPATPEQYATTVLYGAADWNNLTVWRNVTLNADSTLPGLDPPSLRNLRLQIDATLGNGDGTLARAGDLPSSHDRLPAPTRRRERECDGPRRQVLRRQRDLRELAGVRGQQDDDHIQRRGQFRPERPGLEQQLDLALHPDRH